MIDRTHKAAPPMAWAAQLMMTKPRPSTTVDAATAVAPTRGDWRQDGLRQGIVAPPPDPNRPKGPPPSFDANVLEGERERLRRPVTPAADRDGTEGKDRATDVATSGTGHPVAYDCPPQPTPRVDLAV